MLDVDESLGPQEISAEIEQLHRPEQIIIHVGLAKTGSSAIQSFCASNRDVLLRNYRLLVPGDSRRHFHFQTIFSADPSSLLQWRREPFAEHESVHAFCDHYRQQFLDEIAKTKPRSVLITTEYLASMPAQELTAMRAYLSSLADRVWWLAYVRDPWSFATSYAQEIVRNGLRAEPVELGYAESNIEILEAFLQSLGDDAVVRPYVGIGPNRTNVLPDFLSTIGVDPNDPDLVPLAARENEGISRISAGLLVQLNALMPQFDANGRYIFDPVRDWMVEAIVETGKGSDPVALSPAAAMAILEDAAEDLKILDERHFKGDPGFMAAYEATQFSGTSPEISIDNLSRTEVVAALFEALKFLSTRGNYFASCKLPEGPK